MMRFVTKIVVVSALVVGCGLASLGLARELTFIDQALNPAKLQGGGKLTWWGLHVYDATLS